MQGVEILTQTHIATEWAFDWTAFWIMFGIIFVTCSIASIVFYIIGQCKWYIMPILSIIGIAFGFIIGERIGDIAGTPTAYETQYKVTISEEVSMTDFYERYEVIDQDGKIFTVREKTNESN